MRVVDRIGDHYGLGIVLHSSAPSAITMDHKKRIGKLQSRIKKLGVDALLVTNESNVTYLTGFTGDSSYLVVGKAKTVLISDSRYEEQLSYECPDLPLVIRGTGVKMIESLAKAVKSMKLSSLAIEADSMSVGFHQAMAEALSGTDVVLSSGEVETLRMIKDKDEIKEIRFSVRLAEKAMAVVKATMRPEQTELDVAHELENQIRRFGGVGFAFTPIVGVGPRAALPHGHPTTKRIEEDDFVLIDWGALGGLYRSDLTRVLVTGRISPKLERIYGVVLKAQQKAIESIKPGVAMGDVDAAARDTIAKAGFGKRFGHGLGHGIGIDIHESPRLTGGMTEPLKAGMVITIEPGIYIPGWGGVRIEDDVLVTRNGHEVLSSVPKKLEDCVLDL